MSNPLSFIKRKTLLALIWAALKYHRAIVDSPKSSHKRRLLALRQVMALVQRRAELWTDSELRRAERRRGLV